MAVTLFAAATLLVEFSEFGSRVTMTFSAFLLLAFNLFTVASADVAVVSLIGGELSLEDELAIVETRDKLYSESGTRRGLRIPRQERTLAYSCADLCTGWPKGHCIVWQSSCRGYRRRANEVAQANNVGETKNSRQLSITSPDCQAKIKEVYLAMQTAVSTAAMETIQTTTNFMCYNECQVTGFALWNADTDIVVNPFSEDGSMICKNEFTFSFEAIADDCVGSVKFQLTKDSVLVLDRTEYTAPYALFGNRMSDFRGPNAVGLQDLASGAYVLTATPDNDVSMSKTITFTLMDC